MKQEQSLTESLQQVLNEVLKYGYMLEGRFSQGRWSLGIPKLLSPLHGGPLLSNLGAEHGVDVAVAMTIVVGFPSGSSVGWEGGG